MRGQILPLLMARETLSKRKHGSCRADTYRLGHEPLAKTEGQCMTVSDDAPDPEEPAAAQQELNQIPFLRFWTHPDFYWRVAHSS